MHTNQIQRIHAVDFPIASEIGLAVNFLKREQIKLRRNMHADEIQFLDDDVWVRVTPSMITGWRRHGAVKGLPGTRDMMDVAVLRLAEQNCVHPVADYLNKLSWDGRPRVAEFFIRHFGAPDSEYMRFVSTLWLTAAVRRIDEPGCRFDYVAVLEGHGRHAGIKALASPEFYCDELKVGAAGRTVKRVTAGRWIARLTGRISDNAAKTFVHASTDRIIGRHYVDRPRSFVQFATVNTKTNPKYMTQQNNRRLWPIECRRSPDVAGITAERNQIWAEAKTLSDAGGQLWLSDDMEAVANDIQAARWDSRNR